MSEQYRIKDATRDLGFLLTLTKIFEMDDQGFWFDPGLDKRVIHKLDANDDGKEIVVFQDPMPKGDFYYFNPFSEGFGKKSPAVQLYYKTIRIALNNSFRVVCDYVAQRLLDSKTDTSVALDSALVRMTSIPIDRKTTLFDYIDEKTIDEFKTLFDRVNEEIIFVPYMHQQMTAKVKVDVLTDPKWDEKYGKDIRKKSLTAFRCLIMGVLDITSVDQLASFSVKYDPDLKSSARLHTTISVYLKLYAKFNDVLDDAFGGNIQAAIELGELQEVIDRFPLAYAIAKHMVQPVMPTYSATDTKAVDTSRLSFERGTHQSRFAPPVVGGFGQPQSGFYTQPQSQSRFAAPVLNTGPADPFAPATRQPQAQTLPWNQPSAPAFANPGPQMGGGYFGGSTIDLNPPSNFGSAMTRRTYFG